MVMDILFVINAIVIVGFLLIWSLIVFRKKNYTLMEIGWPLSLVLATSVSFLLYGSSSIYRRLLVLTVTIWGLRLAFTLYARHWNRTEGRRYAQMQEKADAKFFGIKAFVSLFIIPAIVFYVVSLPITIGFLDSQSMLVWWQYVGLGLWALGLLIEMGTEAQVRRFKKKPENDGRLITKGFWRLSRHPHYFGTALVWWGIFLLSVVDWNNLLGILSPIVMTLYLVYLASRSAVETEYQEREDLQNYTRKTPHFFPFVTQITAVFSGIGRMVSKLVSSTRKSPKETEPNEVVEPVTENDSNPVPFTESTNETEWFKPDLPEEELASQNVEDISITEEVHPVKPESTIEGEGHDESTIDDILQGNEFSEEINESETLIIDDESMLADDDSVILVEEAEQVDDIEPHSEESEVLIEEDSTEVHSEYAEDTLEEPFQQESDHLNEPPFDVVGEIPGSDVELAPESDSLPDEIETIEETDEMNEAEFKEEVEIDKTHEPIFEENVELIEEKQTETEFEKEVDDFVEGKKKKNKHKS